jgi:hypothetical protein
LKDAQGQDIDCEEPDELDIDFLKEEARLDRLGYMTLTGGVIIQLFLGSFFLWGNISIYVLSYFHEENPEASYNFIFLVDTFLIAGNWTGYVIGTYLF